MRVFPSIMILGLLAACAPAVPDSGSGVGFGNSSEADRAREAALTTGQPLVPPSVLSQESTTSPTTAGTPAATPQPGTRVASSSDDIAAEAAAALAASNANSGVAPLQASPSNPPPDNAGISDENDFAAVTERQTIASDADRIARNRAQYQVIAPKAVPKRVGGSQPNIVEFALKTSNPRGTPVYSRSGFNSAAKSARNCARFASPDLAQRAFLSEGGPERDRKGLDPDGDGFACSWDPAPFRQAARN